MRRTVIKTLAGLSTAACLFPAAAYAQHGTNVPVPPTRVPVTSPHVTVPPTHAEVPTPRSSPMPTAHRPASMTVAQHIDANAQLVSQLRPLLPAGMTLDQAAQGFHNEGQFIATLHASHNLNLPFDQLKSEIVAGDHSLGQAIHDLAPAADAKAEVLTAEAQAKSDIKTTGLDLR